MRTLYLLRHAKSSWDHPGVGDHDRPLAPRGIRAARAIADHMHATGLAPQVLLCSSARRTRETLELLGDAIPPDCEVLVDEDLYGAGSDTLIERVRALPTDAQRAMLIGHNPGMQRLAITLAGSGARLDLLRQKLPTAGLATLDASVDGWDDVAEGCAVLTDFVRPRDLDATG